MSNLYRVGRHQPQNVYRGDQYIGVMFSPADADLVARTLNGNAHQDPHEFQDEDGSWWDEVNPGKYVLRDSGMDRREAWTIPMIIAQYGAHRGA